MNRLTWIFFFAVAAVVVGVMTLSLAAPAPINQTITMRGGRFNKVCGVDANKNIQCNLDTTNDKSAFVVEAMPDGRYALKNLSTNQYCQDNGDNITCNRAQPLEQEKFHWVDQPEANTFSLTGPKSGSLRRFCADEGNRVRCDRATAGAWEKFAYQAIAPATSAIPAATTIPEGASVRCDDGSGRIYRYMDGKLYYYPSPEIASTWNPQWAQSILTIAANVCAGIPKGETLVSRMVTTNTSSTIQPGSNTVPLPAAATSTCVVGCPEGWRNFAGTCYENCPPGWQDQGLLCRGRNSSGQMATRTKKSMKPKCIEPTPPPPPPPPPPPAAPVVVPSTPVTTTATDATPPAPVPPTATAPVPAAPTCVVGCPEGWRNFAGTCYENCLPGWQDQGLLCRGRNSRGQMATRTKKSMKPKCIQPPPAPAPVIQPGSDTVPSPASAETTSTFSTNMDMTTDTDTNIAPQMESSAAQDVSETSSTTPVAVIVGGTVVGAAVLGGGIMYLRRLGKM